MGSGTRPDQSAVFLNVPFDHTYEPLFLALIAATTAIGRVPRCVLELPDQGEGRLSRILALMEACAVSVHDLSRVGIPARFNMPFELGLAYAIRHATSPNSPYRFVLLERVAHRLSRTLSDVSGHDPGIHGGRPLGVIACILDALGTGRPMPKPGAVHRQWRGLMKAARTLKRAEGRDTIFSASLFKRTVAASTELASRAGFIAD